MRMTEELVQQAFASSPAFKYKNSPSLQFVEDTESVMQDKDKFQVKMDLQPFKPEEITVKTIDGNAIQIEAKQEIKDEDKGFISRQVVRRFVLPKGHDLKDVVSSLSSDGVLTVTAPRKVLPEEQERVIPIQHEKLAKKLEDTRKYQD